MLDGPLGIKIEEFIGVLPISCWTQVDAVPTLKLLSFVNGKRTIVITAVVIDSIFYFEFLQQNIVCNAHPFKPDRV